MRLLNRRTSPRMGDAIWMKFECGAGSRWTSTTEDSSGDVCNFSGCNCGTMVAKVGETDDRSENWFGLRAGQTKNPNCDNDKCTRNDGEVRVLPTGGDSNAILCRTCFSHEMRFRSERNKTLAVNSCFHLPMWSDLKVYGSEVAA